MSYNVSSDQITTPTTRVQRTRYVPLEMVCTNMVPNTTYNVYFQSILVNAFCKPFGGNLGAPLVSDSNGRLVFQFHMAMQYRQNYLVAPGNPHVVTNKSNITTQPKTLHLIDAFGNSSKTFIPMVIKA